MPDLDLIKQEEQEPVGQSRRAAAAATSTALPGCCSPARRGADQKGRGVQRPTGGQWGVSHYSAHYFSGHEFG
jgi:hypothetical protein